MMLLCPHNIIVLICGTTNLWHSLIQVTGILFLDAMADICGDGICSLV